MTANSCPSSTGSKRPGTPPAPGSAAAIVASSTPRARAAASATSALRTLKRPGSGARNAVPSTVKSVDAGPARRSVARTAASVASIPIVTACGKSRASRAP